jgi:hypothetical protein
MEFARQAGICLPPLNFDMQAVSAFFPQAIRLSTDQCPDSEVCTTLRLAWERTSDSKGDPQIHDARVVLLEKFAEGCAGE